MLSLSINENQLTVNWYKILNFINTEIEMEFIAPRFLCTLAKQFSTEYRVGLHGTEIRPLLQKMIYLWNS